MNTWQIGMVMWQLALLAIKQLRQGAKEYAPGTINIEGWVQKGKTFGIDLKDTPYSSTLKQMIFECLYEDYELRPEIIDLKNRIQACLKVAISAKSRGDEPWEDFVHPGPEEDDWDPDAWDPDTPDPDEVKPTVVEALISDQETDSDEDESDDNGEIFSEGEMEIDEWIDKNAPVEASLSSPEESGWRCNTQ